MNRYDPSGLDACDPFDSFFESDCGQFDISLPSLNAPIIAVPLFLYNDAITSTSLSPQEQKRKVLDWSQVIVAAQTAGLARVSDTGAPYPKYLRTVRDCYTPSTFTTGVLVRHIDYQLVGSNLADMRDIQAVVSEHLFSINGTLPEPSVGPGGGGFDDRISIEGTGTFRLIQQFTAAVRDVFGIPGFTNIPIYVVNRLGVSFGSNVITATGTSIDVNADKNLNRDGTPHLCP